MRYCDVAGINHYRLVITQAFGTILMFSVDADNESDAIAEIEDFLKTSKLFVSQDDQSWRVDYVNYRHGNRSVRRICELKE